MILKKIKDIQGVNVFSLTLSKAPLRLALLRFHNRPMHIYLFIVCLLTQV